MLSRIIGIFVILLLSSCSTVSPNITQTEQIGPNDGILIAKFHSAQAAGLVEIHHGVMSVPYAGIAIQPNEQQLKVIKIKCATGLRVSTYTVGNSRAYFDNKTLNFDIEPGTITYIGDIVVNQNASSVGLRIIDNENETLAEARKLYPELFSKFRYVKFIPINKHGG